MSDHARDWERDLQELRTREGLETAVNLRPTNVEQIRLSPQVEQYLAEQGESARDLLALPTLVARHSDDCYPLTHYFISSSHNTYLLSRQILGHASALSYTHVLTHHARCIEIDVWSGSSGPIVTHGYTLSQSVPFAEVCEAIGMAVKEGDWPVMLSLECHVSVEGQEELVQIMEGAWGDKLVKKEVKEDGMEPGGVTPGELRGKIVAMIEYYPPKVPKDNGEPPSSSSESDEQEEEEESEGGTKHKVKPPPHSAISDALAALGVYARSMKPSKDWLTQQISYPAHILINISESTLSALLPASLNALIEHSQLHLRRVYPRGTRITSSNLNPLKYWGNGSQIAALNWQNYDRGVQINEAMFVGTPGWVLKPAHLLPEGGKRLKKKRLTCHVVGLSSMPTPEGTKRLSNYILVQLLHPGLKTMEGEWRSKTVKTEPFVVENSQPSEDANEDGSLAKGQKNITDVMWDEKFQFDYEEEGLEFIRFNIWEDIAYSPDVKHLVFVAKTEQIEPGWRLVRMLTPKGKDSGATLLVKFEFMDLFTL